MKRIAESGAFAAVIALWATSVFAGPAPEATMAMIAVAAPPEENVECAGMNADGVVEAFALTRQRVEGPDGVALGEQEVPVDGTGTPGRHHDAAADRLRTLGDVTEASAEFHGDGRVGDERHFEAFGVGRIHLDFLSRQTFRIEGMPGWLTLLQLRGDAYWDEADGSTPYVLLDTQGEELHSGWSFLPPSIFPGTPGPGILVVEAVRGRCRSSLVTP